MKQFSPDRRTYIAAKIIPGYATLIYMAVTNNPDDGWDEDGFAKVATYIPNMKEKVDEIISKFNEMKENVEVVAKGTIVGNEMKISVVK